MTEEVEDVGSDDTKPDATPTPADPPQEQPAPQNVTHIVITIGTMWRAVAVVLLTLAALWAVDQARDLVTMLVISVFFALALVPGVEHLHKKRGWRRGAAVAVIYLVGAVAVVLIVVLLIPAISTVGDEVAKNGSGWMTSLDDWLASTFGVHIVDSQAYKDGVVTVGEVLQKWSDKLLPAPGTALSKGASLVFGLFTIAMFTFYLAADFPRLQRAFLSWFRPPRQQRLGWTIDHSITDVGGYLYSRLLLTLINGTGFFVTMVAVGVPVDLALPLAVFGGFVSEFIPNIGTYIGAAVPVAAHARRQRLRAGARRRRLCARLPADRELLAQPADQRQDHGAERRRRLRRRPRRRRPVRGHGGLHGAAGRGAHRRLHLALPPAARGRLPGAVRRSRGSARPRNWQHRGAERAMTPGLVRDAGPPSRPGTRDRIVSCRATRLACGWEARRLQTARPLQPV